MKGGTLELLKMAGLGALLFGASLVVNGVAGRILHVDVARTRPGDLPASMWLVGLTGTLVLTSLGAWWYFSSRSGGAMSGLVLGLVFVVVGVVLDAVFILPLRNGSQILLGYFRQWQYWLTLSVLMVVSIGVAMVPRP